MPSPLIILGAGASFDYYSEDEKKGIKGFLDFPLADNLCQPQYLYYLEDRIRQREELKKIIDELAVKEIREIFLGGKNYISQIASSLNREQNLEKNVSNIWKTAVERNDKYRQRQLVAFAYYLHFLFYLLSKEFGGRTSNNYYALVNRLSDLLSNNNESETLIVNFNYDLLMDDALKSLEHGVQNRLSHIKVHGSCDKYCISRVTEQDKGPPRMPHLTLSREELIKNFAEYWNEVFEIGPESYDLIYICKEKERGEGVAIRPSLILPFYNKSEYGFPCNKQDLQVIKNFLPRTDRILIIGWRAKDEEFINLIKEGVNDSGKDIRLSVVAGDKDDIADIKQQFNDMFFVPSTDCVKFSNFVSSDACKKFFE